MSQIVRLEIRDFLKQLQSFGIPEKKVRQRLLPGALISQACLQDIKEGRLFFVGADVDDVGGDVVMVMVMSVSGMSLAVAVDFRGKSGALL